MARNLLVITSKLISTTNVPAFSKNTKLFNYVKYSYFTIFRSYSELQATNSQQTPDESLKEQPIKTLSDFKSKYSPGAKYVSTKLQKLFELPAAEVKDLLKKYPKLKKFAPELMQTNYNACTEAGITKEMLLQYPMILTIENINYKLLFLQQLHGDINQFVPLIFSNFYVLKQIVQEAKIEEEFCPYRNRIIYLSHTLNIPAPEICEKIVNHLYVLRFPLERLEKILKVLLDYGIEPRNIINDCWALRYNPAIAEERLQRAIQANVSKVKTWMIRCTHAVLQRCIDRQIENRKILGSNTCVEEYLAKRLECSLDNAQHLTQRYPAILKMNISKMKETLDYLYEQGYTPAHVCRVPRIMIHSQETTKQRIQQLQQLGYPPPSLASLCKSKRDFDKILKKYSKRNKSPSNNNNNNTIVSNEESEEK